MRAGVKVERLGEGPRESNGGLSQSSLLCYQPYEVHPRFVLSRDEFKSFPEYQRLYILRYLLLHSHLFVVSL